MTPQKKIDGKHPARYDKIRTGKAGERAVLKQRNG